MATLDPFAEPGSRQQQELDHTPLTFGMYKGKTPEQVSELYGARGDGWLIWAYENTTRVVCSDAFYRSIGGKNGRPTGKQTTQQQQVNSAMRKVVTRPGGFDDMDDDIPF